MHDDSLNVYYNVRIGKIDCLMFQCVRFTLKHWAITIELHIISSEWKIVQIVNQLIISILYCTAFIWPIIETIFERHVSKCRKNSSNENSTKR